jgi:hypothetical protein
MIFPFRRKPRLNPDSLASVMQHIFREYDVPHDELVKLRRKALDAYSHSKGKVSPASIALVMAGLLKEGKTTRHIRMLSHKTLLSRAAALEGTNTTE